jgi:calcium/proton exchanger cax
MSGVRRAEDTWITTGVNNVHGLLVTAGALYAMINVHGQGLAEIDPNDRQKLQDFLSRSASVILSMLYCLYRLFRGRSHSYLFDVEVEDEEDFQLRGPTIRKTGSGVATALLLCTVWATYVCALPILKILTTTAEEPSTGDAPSNLPSQRFFSFCLLPLLAELAEISRTCSLAWNADMQLAYTIATTTSIHMMLLVAPLFCLSAWCMGISLDLDLGGFEVVILWINIWLSGLVSGDGKSNYLNGFCMNGM